MGSGPTALVALCCSIVVTDLFGNAPAVRCANALSFVKATDEILAAGGLSSREYEFVWDMRAIAKHNASPRMRVRREFSRRQLKWLRDIYLRIPIGQRTWKTAIEVEHCRSIEIEERKAKLIAVGLWPLPEGYDWDSDLTGPDYVPLPGRNFGAPRDGRAR